MDTKRIGAVISQISAERKIPKEDLIEIIEAAISTAYKRDYGSKDENVTVHFDIETGNISISLEKEVVEEVTNPSLEISIDDVDGFDIGDVLELDITDEVLESGLSDSFGRIATQAAKNVIIQRIQESEKKKIYDLFKDKVGEVVAMKVVMIEGGRVIFDYNGNQVVLPRSEQVSRDNYVPDARFYLYVSKAIEDDKYGPKILLSRKDKNIVPAIFAQYVPEVASGDVVIEDVVRRPGIKTKMIVSTPYDELDPAGTLIGAKGIRVKSVMEELSGEKIDIIVNTGYIEDVISKSLSPAKVGRIDIDEESHIAKVFVDDSERAKAIGRSGINISLASKLTGYEIRLVEPENL